MYGNAVDEDGGGAGDVGLFGFGHVFDDDDGVRLSFDGIEQGVDVGAEFFEGFFEKGRTDLLLSVTVGMARIWTGN